MVFTSDRVHILPGYPKESADNPSITLLALYLQFPQDFSDDIVDNDVLKAIVESDASRVGVAVNGTISSVQPFSTTETRDESDEEPKSKNAIIVGVCVGVVILVIILVAIFLQFKRRKR